MKRKTIEEIRSELEKEGCKLVSTEYVSNQVPIEYIGTCGHLCRQTYGYFQQGHGRQCTACNKRKHYDIDDVRNIMEKEGCKLLSTEYKNCRQPLKLLMRCGHERVISLNGFSNMETRLCMKCYIKEQSKRFVLSYDEVRKLFEDNGCVLLSTTYENNHTKLTYIAQCGHVNSTTQCAFRSGSGRVCNRCARCNTITESQCYSILSEMYPDIKYQYNIKTGKTKQGQFLDFYVPSKNLAIELNGAQHYEYTPFFHRSMNGWINQLYRDELKRNYCKANNIILVEIDARDVADMGISKETLQFLIERELPGEK